MPLNKVMLIGNVGKDPDVRHLDTGVAVASFPLATTERGYTLQNGVQVPERTEWHNIVLWRGLADVAERYVHKGDKLYIEGKIKTRSYDDQNGIKRYVTEIFADNMEMLSPKASTNGNANPPAMPQPQNAAGAMRANEQAATAQQAADPFAGGADDLPF